MDTLDFLRAALPSICHDQAGCEALVRLHAATQDCRFGAIEIDLTAVDRFDADMCAALGAILYRLGNDGNTIQLTHIPTEIEPILTGTGFLSYYGRVRLPEVSGMLIPYQRFDTKDDRYFASYVETRLIGRPELAAASPGLLKKLRESVFELFSNAVLHSRSRLGIFSCGQHDPRRHRLNFAVADLGVGIPQNVRQHAGLDLTAEEAVRWATEGRNTTKRGPIPGGLGLKLLKEFIGFNGGRIQIVSDAGYWCMERGQARITRLSHPFPGTVVNIEVNLADARPYALHSELVETDVF
jgi:signal transduction histidine kinase